MSGFAGLEDLDKEEIKENLDGGAPPKEESEPKGEEKDAEGGESNDGDGGGEEAPKPRKGRDKRIDALTGEMAKLKKQRDRDRADFLHAQKLIAERDAALEEFRRKQEDPDLPAPSEDDGPDAHIAYLRQRQERADRKHEAELHKIRMENLENVQRAVHSDFDELRSKWESTFLSQPDKVAILREAADPMAKFYELAKKAEKEEAGEAETDRDLQAAKGVVDGTQAPRADADDEDAESSVSNDDWRRIQRIFPGKYKTREEYAKDAAAIDKQNRDNVWK